jgi:hypothetical protein
MAGPKPIETRYAGCRFRSRLEARWAVFFDRLGIAWEYEPEGFELAPLPKCRPECPSPPRSWFEYALGFERRPMSASDICNCSDYLGGYLPDFWLPEQAIWFEVKGVLSELGAARLLRFAILTRQPIAVAVGAIPGVRAFGEFGYFGPDPSAGFNMRTYYHPGWMEGACAWTLCTGCDRPGVTQSADSERVYRHSGHVVDPVIGRTWRGNDPRILAAYEAARSARFEYGAAGGQ